MDSYQALFWFFFWVMGWLVLSYIVGKESEK